MPSKKIVVLGMSYGKARSQLNRNLMFKMACRLGDNFCFRCGGEIETALQMSVEHKEAWLRADDPVEAFFDLDNITFSHRSCNYAAAHRPHKKYATRAERIRVQSHRHRQTDGWKATVAKRREKRRLARLENSTGVVQ